MLNKWKDNAMFLNFFFFKSAFISSPCWGKITYLEPFLGLHSPLLQPILSKFIKNCTRLTDKFLGKPLKAANNLNYENPIKLLSMYISSFVYFVIIFNNKSLHSMLTVECLYAWTQWAIGLRTSLISSLEGVIHFTNM